MNDEEEWVDVMRLPRHRNTMLVQLVELLEFVDQRGIFLFNVFSGNPVDNWLGYLLFLEGLCDVELTEREFYEDCKRFLERLSNSTDNPGSMHVQLMTWGFLLISSVLIPVTIGKDFLLHSMFWCSMGMSTMFAYEYCCGFWKPEQQLWYKVSACKANLEKYKEMYVRVKKIDQ
jgi:hypothetical protein